MLSDTTLMESARDRFQTTLDLFATGVELRRQSLRREHPGASNDEIEQMLNQWLSHRPGAEHGDGPQPAP